MKTEYTFGDPTKPTVASIDEDTNEWSVTPHDQTQLDIVVFAADYTQTYFFNNWEKAKAAADYLGGEMITPKPTSQPKATGNAIY